MMDTKDEALVWASEGPNVAELQAELNRCSPEQAYWNRVEDADDVRFCRWPGQSADGLKHDTEDAEAFPWSGASDTRVHLADAIVNELAAVCVNAFNASIAHTSGREPSDMEAAGGLSKVVEHLLDLIDDELRDEVELSAQYVGHYGWTLLHPTWRREVQMEQRTVRLDELVQLALAVGRQDPQHPLARLPEVIMDPEQDAVAMELLKAIHGKYLEQNLRGIDPSEWPMLTKPALRKILKALRTEGLAEVPVPYLCRNEPKFMALKPYEDVFLSDSVTDVQKARVFVRHFMTEADVRAMGINEGWDDRWIEEAVKLKGHTTRWLRNDAYDTTGYSHYEQSQRAEHDLVEVFYCYERRLNEDGIPMILCTVFHAMMGKDKDSPGKDLVAKHGPLDYAHGRLPFVPITRERWSRSIPSSRGVPEVVATWQFEQKAQRDSLVDRTSFSTLPSVLVPGSSAAGLNYKFGPGAQIPYKHAQKPEFMEVPRFDGTALTILEMLEGEADNYFGRLSEKVPAPRIHAKQQVVVDRFLKGWKGALRQMLQLALQYMDAEEWHRVTGAPKPQVGQQGIARLYDFDLAFDARTLDMDFTMKSLEAISKLVVPEDVTGSIDREKLTRAKLMAINPSLARELMMDKGSASQKLFEQVRDDMAQMFLGNEARYVENDPTARAKLQFATQVIQTNPNYQQGLQQGGRFAELVQTYAANLQHSIQQQENAMVGRIGVQPVG